MGPRAGKSGFGTGLADGRPIGPSDPLPIGPEIADALPSRRGAEGRRTHLSGRVRQVAVPSVAAVFEAAVSSGDA